jgi:hypothetical protein
MMESVYGREWFDSDYLYDGTWAGCKSGPALGGRHQPPSDGYLLDDHYETSVRDEPLHESIAYRRPARVGQWLDVYGNIQLDVDGSLTNINGANIRDAVRCCNSRNLVFDRTDPVSALEGMEIPLGLSLNAVAQELNEDPYIRTVREVTGREPDLMLCHREEEALELRLQAACEGIVEDRDGCVCVCVCVCVRVSACFRVPLECFRVRPRASRVLPCCNVNSRAHTHTHTHTHTQRLLLGLRRVRQGEGALAHQGRGRLQLGGRLGMDAAPLRSQQW